MITDASAANSAMITVNTLSGAQLRVELAQQATIKDLKGAIKRLIGMESAATATRKQPRTSHCSLLRTV